MVTTAPSGAAAVATVAAMLLRVEGASPRTAATQPTAWSARGSPRPTKRTNVFEPLSGHTPDTRPLELLVTTSRQSATRPSENSTRDEPTTGIHRTQVYYLLLNIFIPLVALITMSLTTTTKKKTTRIRGSTHIGGLNQPPPRSYREVVSPAVYSEKQYKQFCQLHSLNNLIRHWNPEAPVTTPTEIVQWFVKVIQDDSDYPYPHHKQALADSFDTQRGNFTDSAFALWAF